MDAAAKAPAARARKTKIAVDGDIDEDLFAALKALQANRETQTLATYLVFKDQSLADMAVRKPQTLDAFEEVFGVGKAKRDKFGKQFIEVIERFL